jgi:hypothetical protein
LDQLCDAPHNCSNATYNRNWKPSRAENRTIFAETLGTGAIAPTPAEVSNYYDLEPITHLGRGAKAAAQVQLEERRLALEAAKAAGVSPTVLFFDKAREGTEGGRFALEFAFRKFSFGPVKRDRFGTALSAAACLPKLTRPAPSGAEAKVAATPARLEKMRQALEAAPGGSLRKLAKAARQSNEVAKSTLDVLVEQGEAVAVTVDGQTVYSPAAVPTTWSTPTRGDTPRVKVLFTRDHYYSVLACDICNATLLYSGKGVAVSHMEIAEWETAEVLHACKGECHREAVRRIE